MFNWSERKGYGYNSHFFRCIWILLQSPKGRNALRNMIGQLTGFSRRTVRSTTETLGVGTRKAMPVSLLRVEREVRFPQWHNDDQHYILLDERGHWMRHCTCDPASVAKFKQYRSRPICHMAKVKSSNIHPATLPNFTITLCKLDRVLFLPAAQIRENKIQETDFIYHES